MSTHDDDLIKLDRLIKARHACILIPTTEEEEALMLVRQAAMSRPDTVLRGWSHTLGVHEGLYGDGDPQPVADTANPAAAMVYLRQESRWQIAYLLDAIGSVADDPCAVRALRDLIEHTRRQDRTLVMIDHHSEIPPIVNAHATTMELSLPGEDELEQLVRETLRKMHRRKAIRIDITKSQFQTVLKNLRGMARREAEQIITDAVAEDRAFTADDINHILAMKRQALKADGLLEYVETPVDLGSIGGLNKLKRWLKMRREGDSVEAREFGISPPRGVLMLGVQGAGKSMCAKAISTAWQRPLLRLDPGALFDRYVGESERRLRQALAQAEAMSPIVLWVDEIEKGFSSASGGANDGGIAKRMFGTLLTWMQEHEAPVFLVATANDISALPPELLRKGRFDEIFFVDLPRVPTRRQIFTIHLRKRNRDPKAFDLAKLVEASDGYSGAEIEQAIVSALHEAWADKADLDTDRIINALNQSPPLSVTMAEKVHELRQWAETRCVPAD